MFSLGYALIDISSDWKRWTFIRRIRVGTCLLFEVSWGLNTFFGIIYTLMIVLSILVATRSKVSVLTARGFNSHSRHRC